MNPISTRIVLLLLLALAGQRAPGDTPTPQPQPRRWTIDGVQREALVYVPPEQVAGGGALPVLFAFHGHGGSAQGVAARWGYHREWPEAIVVYPQGLPTPGPLTDPEGRRAGWQHAPGDQGDRDLKFIDAILGDLRKEQRVDDARVYATGHSNGGGFTYLLWATRGEAFAAVAPSGSAAARLLPRLRPKPALHVAGRNDPLVKYAWQQQTLDRVRTLNRCAEGRPWELADNPLWVEYPSPIGAPLVTYIHDGGHEFPREVVPLIVRFFRQHALAQPNADEEKPSTLKPDERVILFPAAAHRSDDGQTWEVTLRGWVFEPEKDSVVRNRFLGELCDALDVEPGSEREKILRERLAWFLVDNERGKRIGVRIGAQTRLFPGSDEGGRFVETLTIPAAEAGAIARDGRIETQVVLPEGDERRMTGVIELVEPVGLSVISDIDDTIKVSEVRDKVALLENTFARPFQPVPGMAERYRRWEIEGAAFHYVSSSPRQLHEPLAAFLRGAGFPAGELHLKDVRLKDRSILTLLDDPLDSKPAVIREVLRRYPGRTFLLVGDSGEKDPEVYGGIAREFRKQVRAIYIRDVTGEGAGSPRYADAFADLPRDLWHIFTDPGMIGDR